MANDLIMYVEYLHMPFLKNPITNKSTASEKLPGYKKNMKGKYVPYILAIRTQNGDDKTNYNSEINDKTHR